jgi:formate dehydrogenase iron-sulfur subunit
MRKAFFVDTSVCTGCRACQVACKQWHDLPAENTTNRGTFQNPPDLSFDTYKLVRMKEGFIEGRMRWLFFADQCRHCVEPPCRDTARDEAAIYQDAETGAVLYTAKTKELNGEEILDSCPYNIPRKGPDGALAKCDMCIDRVQNGLMPACVKTCPTGAMNFGERDEMLKLAGERLKEVQKTSPKAQLLDPDDVSVIYLVEFERNLYEASAHPQRPFMTRQMAMRKMFGPVTRAMSRIG